MKKAKKKLTPKQERFCQEYVIDSNGTQAAIRSGYSEKTAKEQAAQHLTKLNIQNRISELQQEISNRNKITIDDCVGILTNLAKFDLKEIYNADGSMRDISDIPEEHRMAIEGLDIEEIKKEQRVIGLSKKPKFTNRRAAVVELMKYLGGYEKDNHQKAIQIKPTRYINATGEN